MLLKDLIKQLQELYLEEIKHKAGTYEPEILIDNFKQKDMNNFERDGYSSKISIHSSVDGTKRIISCFDSDPADIDKYINFNSPNDKKDNVKYQISLLNKFPKTRSKIESLWGTFKGREYINGLVVGSINHDDHNLFLHFPSDIYLTLNNILELHDKVYPAFKPISLIWDNAK